MKYLIFAFVSAFILENYGVSQAKSLKDYSPDEQVQLFRKYVLNLIDAVIPALQDQEILDDACACIPIFEQSGEIDSLMAVFATFSIAKDYLEDLDKLRRAPDNAQVRVSPGMMANIRRILVVYDNPTANFSVKPSAILIKEYLLARRNEIDRGASASRNYDDYIETAKKCYRTIVSTGYRDNGKFFNTLIKGFIVASHLYKFDAEGNAYFTKWDDLRKIIQVVPQYGLTPVNYDFAQREFLEVIGSLASQ